MESLTFLYRMYLQIVGSAGEEWDPRCDRKLDTWLKDDVLPEIHKLSRRQKFREQARWPLDHLVAGSDFEERKRIDEVDRLVVKTAHKLGRALHAPDFDERVANLFSARFVSEEKVVIGGGEPVRTVERKIGTYCKAKDVRCRIDHIASRFWPDLVSSEDYFEPVAGWPSCDGKGLFHGMFAPSLTPEVHSGGDFISRCTILRLEALLGDVEEAVSITTTIFPERFPHGRPIRRSRPGAIAGLRDLRECTRHLRHLLLENENQPLRDACILLTQVGAASSDQFDLTWLGTYHPLAWSGMSYRLRRRTKELFERIARSLLTVRDFYAQQPPLTTELDEAIAENGLVITEATQEAIWKGQPIAANWTADSREFKFLLLLAKRAFHRQSVGDDDPELYEEPPGRSAISTLLGRLKKRLPPSLRKLIEKGHKVRSYKLTLNGSLIRIF